MWIDKINVSVYNIAAHSLHKKLYGNSQHSISGQGYRLNWYICIIAQTEIVQQFEIKNSLEKDYLKFSGSIHSFDLNFDNDKFLVPLSLELNEMKISHFRSSNKSDYFSIDSDV